MSIYAIVLCCVILVVVHGQYPRFELNGSILVNNSFINRRTIGTGDGALKCVTNSTTCCTDPVTSYWTNPADRPPWQGDRGGYLFVTRGSEVVSLNRRNHGDAGMWRCSIPDSTGMMRNIYIYTGSPPGFAADG